MRQKKLKAPTKGVDQIDIERVFIVTATKVRGVAHVIPAQTTINGLIRPNHIIFPYIVIDSGIRKIDPSGFYIDDIHVVFGEDHNPSIWPHATWSFHLIHQLWKRGPEGYQQYLNLLPRNEGK